MTFKNPDDNMDIPDWARWLAQDADGTWWAYEAEPHQHHQGWYENEVGRSLKLNTEPANHHWQSSLQAHSKK